MKSYDIIACARGIQSNPIQSNPILDPSPIYIPRDHHYQEEKNKNVFDDDNFMEFYKIYPKHTEKEESMKKWISLNIKKNNPNSLTPQQIIDILKKQIGCGMFDKEDKKYIMSERRWLNRKRWEDEIIQKPQTKKTAYDKILKLGDANCKTSEKSAVQKDT